jgi:hypothetical protein
VLKDKIMSDKYENWNSGDFIDECEANRMEIGSLTASRDEWERLWKKASISVIDLQDEVEKLKEDRLDVKERIAKLETAITSVMTEEQLDCTPDCFGGLSIREALADCTVCWACGCQSYKPNYGCTICDHHVQEHDDRNSETEK